MAQSRICTIEGCGKRIKGHGLCNTHNERRRLRGAAFVTQPIRKPVHAARLFDVALSADPDACVPWPHCVAGNGYGMLSLKGERITAHRHMCTIAHGEPPPKHDAAHSCGLRICINPHHLRWATRSENCADMVLHGTQSRGERHSSKLTEEDVRTIRTLYSSGDVTQEELGRIFKVSDRTIGKITTQTTWKWLAGA